MPEHTRLEFEHFFTVYKQLEKKKTVLGWRPLADAARSLPRRFGEVRAHLMTSRFTRFKAALLGRPLASHQAEHQLLPKRLALPVFASDPLSRWHTPPKRPCSCWLSPAPPRSGSSPPVSFAVASLLAVVVLSYRQTIRAYPQGGGAFLVAQDNFSAFGRRRGCVVADGGLHPHGGGIRLGRGGCHHLGGPRTHRVASFDRHVLRCAADPDQSPRCQRRADRCLRCPPTSSS